MLTPRQRQYLRGLGHHLQAIVQIGKEGLSEPFLLAADHALSHHELIKVKVLGNAPTDRDAAPDALAKALRAEVAQVLGNNFLLYRAHPDEPKISLPSAAKDRAEAKAKAKAAKAKRAGKPSPAAAAGGRPKPAPARKPSRPRKP